jgi:type IV secretion system protein VirD4
VIWDLKGELWERTSQARDKFSHVLRFAPAEIENTVRYNPLSVIRRGKYAIMDAQNVAELLPWDNPGHKGDVIWDTAAKNYMAAVILFALAFEKPAAKCLAGVASLLSYGRALGDAMLKNRHLDAEVRTFIAEASRRLWANESERYIGSVLGTANSYLVPYTEPILADNTRSSDFTPSGLMCGKWPVSLYLGTTKPNLDRVQPLLRIMISQFMAELQESETADRSGKAKLWKLLWALDEVPALGRLANLGADLPAMRSFGMRCLMGAQGLRQLWDVYGVNTPILQNARWIVTRQNSIAEARDISEMVGEAREETESISRSASPYGMPRGVNKGPHYTWRRALQVADVTRLPADRLLIFGEEKTIKAWRTPPDYWRGLVAAPVKIERREHPCAWDDVSMESMMPIEIERETKKRAKPKPTGKGDAGAVAATTAAPPAPKRKRV